MEGFAKKRIDPFLFELIPALKNGIEIYGKREMCRLINQIFSSPKIIKIKQTRLTSLQHLRGVANIPSEKRSLRPQAGSNPPLSMR